MFLSIIIPHYNIPHKLVERCLQSIIAQGMPHDEYEIIIVDDGSKEAPFWLLDIFPNENIRIISIEHSGLSEARNKGMLEAKGKYIMFIDADDCLQPQSIHNCIETLKKELPQILRYDFKVCKNNKNIKRRGYKRYKTSNTISGAAFMAKTNLKAGAWLYFFQKDLAIKHNIQFIRGIYHEDEYFTTILHYHATTLINSNALIYNYCIRPNSITTAPTQETRDKRISDLITTLKELIKFRNEQTGKSNPLQKEGLNRKITTLTTDTILNIFYNNKSAKEAKKICNSELKDLGLYPLPFAKYSLKYRVFRIIANNTIGLYLLRALLPKHRPA